MNFDIITLFPEMFRGVFTSSLIGKAQEKGVVDISVHNLRDWSQDKHNKVDDRPYGGGPGMVIKPGPVFRSVESLRNEDTELILLSPRGSPLDQKTVETFAEEQKNLLLLCGHYEGFDERVRTGLNPTEISIGDYVLTGGEIPAMVLVDSVARLIPGVVGSEDSLKNESFSGKHPNEGSQEQGNQSKILDFPQYTRPRTFRGMNVPEVLLSGNHQKIREWRQNKAKELTLEHRPDLLEENGE